MPLLMREVFVANNKSLLIVESTNDKYFIEALINPNNIDLSIDTPICKIADYECLEGVNLKKITNKLEELKTEIQKRDFSTIGILLDADDVGIEARLMLINDAFKKAEVNDVSIEEVNTLYRVDSLDVNIICHILNIDGKGELDTILKTIKSEPSDKADCLEKWQECLTDKISEKEFNKFWVNIYQRYDCCSNEQKRQAGRKCNMEASMKKNIWNFSHDCLKELNVFLGYLK